MTKYFESDLRDELSGEERFVYNFGYYNCELLTLKSMDEILDELETDGNVLDDDIIQFISQNENKEVLVYSDGGDYFVYDDNNWVFTRDCFK